MNFDRFIIIIIHVKIIILKSNITRWATSEDTVLDPTNEYGDLELELRYLFGLVKADTKIARINEPPPGKDCNVYSRVNGPVVEIVNLLLYFIILY